MGDLEIGLEQLQQSNLLALKFILDDRSVEQTLEGVEHLEFADDGVAVVEGLGEHGG